MKHILPTLCMLLIMVAAQAQETRQITERVTDEQGGALPGVSISQQGTTADADRKYTLSVAAQGTTLIFSYIGYITQDVTVGNSSTLDIVLKTDTKSLNEVVVVGYGTQRKAEVATAVGSIEGRSIAERGTVNPMQAVQGRLQGSIFRQDRAGRAVTISSRFGVRTRWRVDSRSTLLME